MNQERYKDYSYIAWILFALVMAAPYVAWANSLGGSANLNSYTVFPLLGLWAFGVMWTHYAYGTLCLLNPKVASNPAYKKLSGYLVLLLILLHPFLLANAQHQNLKKLPPESYFLYVGSANKFFVQIAAVALTAFLIYEVLHHLTKQAWVQRIWPWVSLSQMVAMTLIFIHGLGIGRHLQSGWLQAYWVILGILLIPCFLVIGKADWGATKSA